MVVFLSINAQTLCEESKELGI